MYRSSSWTRVSDEYQNMIPSSEREEQQQQQQLLPIYDESIARRERARLRFAENAVHLIPFVLILCALILWLFSSTPGTGLGSEREPIAAKLEGFSIEFDDSDSDVTQIGIIQTVDLGGIDEHMITELQQRTKLTPYLLEML